MSSTRPPFDSGLQPERTALAWRRTALALGTAWLVAARVAPADLGMWTLVPIVAGAVLSIGVFAASHRRYRLTRVHPADQPSRVGVATAFDGRLPLVVSGVTLILGLGAVVFVIAR